MPTSASTSWNQATPRRAGRTGRRFTFGWTRPGPGFQQTAEATEGDSVFVTHGLVCYSLALRHLHLGDGVEPPTRWGNTSVTHVQARAPWEASLVNCCDHLDAATADGGQVSGI